jgi:hypothetical protein
MNERHVQLLRHIGLYRVSLRSVLSRQPFGGKTIGNVIQTVRREGLLVARRGLGGTLSYYQLTRDGAVLIGLPEDRAKPFGSQALHTHLAILAFCCLSRTLRVRLDTQALASLFPKDLPAGDHCLEKGKQIRLYRVYAPGPATSMRAILARVHGLIDEAGEHAKLSEWMEERRYAFAVLVDSPERRAEVWNFVRGKEEGERDAATPMSVTHFAVESVPRYGIQTGQDSLGGSEGEDVSPEESR